MGNPTDTKPQPALFRKKPVTISAVQWFKNGDHPEDDVFRPDKATGMVPAAPQEGAVVKYFRNPETDEDACKYCGCVIRSHGYIKTLEGGHIVCPGDWIVTGVQGERYPVKPDIFAQTYEPVA